MEKFVYVFDAGAAEALASCGAKKIWGDERRNIYVFENSSQIWQKYSEREFVLSDVLTFGAPLAPIKKEGGNE